LWHRRRRSDGASFMANHRLRVKKPRLDQGGRIADWASIGIHFLTATQFLVRERFALVSFAAERSQSSALGVEHAEDALG
ncbi:MAG: hypothetical protein WBC92_18290, partial [Terracidiphilus sp.]